MQATDKAPTQWMLIRGIRQLLTLSGPGGPRRGTAAGILNVIPDAAILLRNGVVDRVGKARGVENTREARNAQELDARGAVILPGFVEPDAVIAPPGPQMPRKQRELAAARAAMELGRYGYSAAGAHTADAEDLREVVKILRAHQNAQLRPLRIRPIVSLPFMEAGRDNSALLETVERRWLPSVQKRRLAVIAEVTVHDGGAAAGTEDTRKLVEVAAGLGFAVRFRSIAPMDAEQARFAAAAGAIAVVAPLDFGCPLTALQGSGVHVVPCAGLLSLAPRDYGHASRNHGVALALSSGYNAVDAASVNPQLLLYLACSRLGMTSEEAITAMTWNAACSLRMSNVAGSLDVGRPADLVALDVGHYADMVRRAGNNDVTFVMRGGRIVYARGVVS